MVTNSIMIRNSTETLETEDFASSTSHLSSLSTNDSEVFSESLHINSDSQSKAGRDTGDSKSDLSRSSSAPSFQIQFSSVTPKFFGKINMRDFIAKKKSLAKPLFFDRLHEAKRGTDQLIHKITPALNEVKNETRKATEWIGTRAALAGLSVALKGVQLITGKQSAQADAPRTDMNSDEEDYLDCPGELAEIEHVPVHIPELLTEPNVDRKQLKKDKQYFVNLKEARYKAVVEQAQSPFTKELARKYLSGEIKQSVQPLTTENSLGPRVRVGFKCDVEQRSLTIKLTEASNLPGMDRNGLSDAYCMIQLKPDAAIPTLRTKTIWKTLHPQWKEVFELSHVPPITELQRQTLHIKVFDHDQLGSDDILGYLDIRLAQYDLIGGVDQWFDLKAPKAKHEVKDRGSVYAGIRWEESQERITLFIERCQQLEATGVLVIKACLHINGGLIHSKNIKREAIATHHPDLKRRLTFSGIKKSLLEEYTISIYFGLKKPLWVKYIGQVNLSSKSKNREEQDIWQEMTKLPGDVAFKLIPIQPFLGLVRKPWKPPEDVQIPKLGFLDMSLKSSDVKDGMTFTVTINRAEELLLPAKYFLLVRAFLVKDSVEQSNQKCRSVKMGDRITAIEERFTFFVPYTDVKMINIAVVVYHKHLCRETTIGQVYLSSDYTKSTNDELEVWRTAVKTTGLVVNRRFEIRKIVPQITQYNLTKATEKVVPMQDSEMLFSRQKLGSMIFSANYDSHSEQLQLFVERFNKIAVVGDLYVEAFFWDLRTKIRFRCRTNKVPADDPNPEFKEILKFKHLHSSFFQTQYLFIRLVKGQTFGRNSIAGQIVLKLNSPKT